MKKEHRTNRRYSAEFKIRVILDMRNNRLVYNETVYKYWDVKNSVEAHNYAGRLKLWERIYLEEGEAGFMVEKRGRAPFSAPCLALLAPPIVDAIFAGKAPWTLSLTKLDTTLPYSWKEQMELFGIL